MVLKTALALNCKIPNRSVFHRKNYFYPDLPKGYQISQYEAPICEHGWIEIAAGGVRKRVRIRRAHLEEDAGKNLHEAGSGMSLVDLNRAGTPLLEIVTEPDLSSSEEVVAYLKSLRELLMYLDVCDGNMEEGSFRCEPNLSLRPVGQTAYGTKVELKNINSFKFVKDAVDYEIKRQTKVLSEGGKIYQETRLWNHERGETAVMRSKEEAHDYRYFPDPDLVPLILKTTDVDRIRAGLPELAHQKRARYVTEFGLPEYDAGVLTAERDTALYFEEVLKAGAPAKKASNWVMVEMLAIVKAQNKALSALFPPTNLAELIHLIDSGVISGKIAKEVFADMVSTGKKPKAIVDEKGMSQVSDEGAIREIVLSVMAEHPASVADFKAGKDRALKHLQGEIMKKTRGKVNPQVANKLLGEELAK